MGRSNFLVANRLLAVQARDYKVAVQWPGYSARGNNINATWPQRCYLEYYTRVHLLYKLGTCNCSVVASAPLVPDC